MILSLLVTLFIGSAIENSAHAQLFNSSKKKTSGVYHSAPKNTSNSSEESGQADNVAPAPEVKGDTTTTTNPSSQAKSSPKLDDVVLGHVKDVTSSCLNTWDGQTCMKALSSMNMTLASTYAQTLHSSNKKSYMGRLKNGCAASTAALEVSVPAYAMRSAIAECVNIMTTISEKTSVFPDPSLSQLAISAFLCMGQDKSCDEIEKSLVAIAQK